MKTTDYIPRLFEQHCPKCNHELCGFCGSTFHFDKVKQRNVTDGEFCCKCDATFRIEGARYD